jgi:hypothetical protein
MFHAKYLSSSLCSFEEEDFLKFNYMRKTNFPWDGPILTPKTCTSFRRIPTVVFYKNLPRIFFQLKKSP